MTWTINPNLLPTRCRTGILEALYNGGVLHGVRKQVLASTVTVRTVHSQRHHPQRRRVTSHETVQVKQLPISSVVLLLATAL